MKVGTLTYATDQGLSYLVRDFYTHGIVTDVLIVRHGRRETHEDWYPRSTVIASLKGQVGDMRDFCTSMDAMLFFETPFRWRLVEHCRRAGVRTVLMVMHECSAEKLDETPDVILCPSMLDHRCFPNGVYMPVPVEVPWRLRTHAKVFVHNAGNGGILGRNGTRELYEALQYVKNPIKLIFRAQEQIDGLPKTPDCCIENVLIDYRFGTQPKETLWDEGDVFVFPEKFNGLSLPLQEARAAGMLVMTTNRFPNNEWLPNDPLIPMNGTHRYRIGTRFREFDVARVDPKSIAQRMDDWYGQDISAYSAQGRVWAETRSWEVLKPKYLDVLCA